MQTFKHTFKWASGLKAHSTITRIVLHCASTPEGRDYSVEQIHKAHLARKFSGIGYHFVIYRDGTIHEFRLWKCGDKTIPKRLSLILLAFLVEHLVFIHVEIPLSYIVTGVICFEQAWSIMENESSCRDEADSKFWRWLQKIMVDKTARHFDVDLNELKDDKHGNN